MKLSHTSLTVAAILALQFSTASAGFAGAPSEQIRAKVEQVYQLLATSESTQAPGRREAVRKIVTELFDWAEMAKQSLGQHWNARTPEERAEFVQLFAGLFEHAYLSKVQLADADKFQYLGDTIVGDTAVVRTRVVTKHGNEIPVDYRTQLKGGTAWRVYDLDIEGLSLVGNYRAQFNSIIRRSSYRGLVNQLKAAAEKRPRTS